MQAPAAISSRGFAGGQSFPTALTVERWNVALTSGPLLGMFCIPLPGSGQVASSKNEGQQLPKKKKRERRKRTVYNQSIVGEVLLFSAKLEIRTRCLTF